MGEIMGIREFEKRLGNEMVNWLRWGRKRDWLPSAAGCLLGKRVVSKNRDVQTWQEPVDTASAVYMENRIGSLPERPRQAFLLHYLGKAAIGGKMKRSRSRHDSARLLEVGLTQYQRLLGEALAALVRTVEKDERQKSRG